ncbi:unnamed protein product [Larinioides sclopetarius]|uniref:Uncharacterized protein n=1 Tax=Larinioides sclopetarius TaxID=280406 RepID=A0AAV1Z3P1_9ARAC
MVPQNMQSVVLFLSSMNLRAEILSQLRRY